MSEKGDKVKSKIVFATKMFKATHKVSILGFNAYMDLKEGTIRGTNKTVTMILKILVLIVNFWRVEKGKPEIKVKIVEKFEGKKLV